MNKLTIGMPVYDDYNGVYFTLQHLRQNRFTKNAIDYVVVDNNPNSDQGKAVMKLCKDMHDVKYVPYSDNVGSAAAKNQVLKHADTDWTMCVDSHVLVSLEGLNETSRWLRDLPENALYHGPLALDSQQLYYTHMEPVWRGGMYGIWSDALTEERLGSRLQTIPMHGMGLFLVHTNYWPGFNDDFTGFGGEEGYIHQKVRQRKGDILCIPDLQWVHRFHNQVTNTAYPNRWEERIRNYYIGFTELNRFDMWQDCKAHFKEHLTPDVYESVQKKLPNIDLS